MRIGAPIVLLALGLAGCVPLAPPPDNYVPVWPHGAMVQGMLGVAEMSEDPLDAFVAARDGGSVGSTTLPLMMVAVQHPLAGAHVQPGVEWGGSLAWNRDATYVRSGDSGTRVRAENDLWAGDLFVGGFLTAWLEGGTRVYVGSGPLVHYGFLELEYENDASDLIREQDSGYGTGVYARAGVEVPLWDNTWIGLQVRWLDAHLDFSGDVGTLDFETVQFMLSVTQGL